MEECLMTYREVIPDQTNPEKWMDITLIAGGSQSTLQDIKVAEKAGGYAYKDTTKNHNRNRFIYWRTSHDVLELSEISLDLNLYENNVRYKFTDSPVLDVSVFESLGVVVILVATVGSIHRLDFNHPDTIHTRNETDTTTYSIFHDASRGTHPSSLHVIGQSTSTNNPIPHSATSYLASNGKDAMFSFAYQSNLMLYTMNHSTGQTTSMELKQHQFVPRIFSNITGALRGKSTVSDTQFATSLAFDSIGKETFLYALYRDDQIRMWSTKTGQCVSTVSCLQEGMESRAQGPQTNLLRKSSAATLCAFLCYSTGSEFVTIQTTNIGTNYSMTRKNMIPAPQYDLVDFEINDSRIWGLWCNSQGFFNVSSFSLTPGNGFNWITAALEPPPDRYSIPVERGVDPREAFCSYIFHPGKFQRNVIAKALTMFRRVNISSDMESPMTVLKDRVCQAVENEIQNEIKEYELSEEEFLEVSSRLWERFYSCCEQYHVKASQPIGLVQMESVGGVCLVKKNMFSLLRPCEGLEHLMLAGENAQIEHLSGTPMASDVEVCSDLVELVKILAMLEEQLEDDVKVDIDSKLFQLQLPNNVVAKFVTEMLARENDDSTLTRGFMVKIRQQIRSITDLPNAMILLLDNLRMDHGEPQAMETYSSVQEYSRVLLSMGNLFGSNYGISVVAESLRQISLIRYSLSRNLLILQQILIETFSLQSSSVEIVRSRCMPETVLFVQAYYVMVWLSETPVNPSTSATSLENSIQRLTMIQLSDSRHYMTRATHPMSLLELFLRGKGSQTGMMLFSEGPYRNLTDSQWQYVLLPLVTIIGQLVWAISGNFVFGEWLIGSCQHVLIQEYVRLLNSWCEWNNCSRHFILAVSLLDNGERHKSFDLFMQAAKGVTTEPFLKEKILSSQDNTTNEPKAQYYLKIIQLFEQYSAFDCVISMAQTAIGCLESNDPQLAMFQSIVFTNHLALEHFEESYHSLINNSEHSRRKDCLRQLVVELFKQKRLDLLMFFPYVKLQTELENIVESRASSMGPEDNIYYDFLYAFHITKGNMRQAATIMYKRSMRFLLECKTADAMQSRYNSLMACINSLSMVDEKYAYIAKPAINEKNMIQENNMEVDDQQFDLDKKIDVLEINDLKKELLLTEAVLLVAKHKPEINSILHAGAPELIAVLCSLSLFTSAVKLSNGFGLCIGPILESVASSCVNAVYQEDPWSWVEKNNITDLLIKDNAVDTAWNLLKELIETHEKNDSTVLRKAVTTKILKTGAFLPQWLYNSYKMANPSEMLYLFVSSGRLIEATDLAMEYIRGMLGQGFEYFGLKNALHSTEPALCFPINTIDLLLYGLKINFGEDEEYVECHRSLKKLVNSYIQNLSINASSNRINYSMIQIH